MSTWMENYHTTAALSLKCSLGKEITLKAFLTLGVHSKGAPCVTHTVSPTDQAMKYYKELLLSTQSYTTRLL